MAVAALESFVGFAEKGGVTTLAAEWAASLEL